MKARVKYLDMVKAFAFLFVVLGHTKYQLPDDIFRFAFAFHMPIFFIVSGYFFKTDKITVDFMKKSFKSLILPYIYATLAVIAINIIIDINSGANVFAHVRKWISAMFYGSGSRTDWEYWPTKVYTMGATWFLLAMFWARIILASVLGWFKDNIGGQFFVVIVIAFAGYYMSNNGQWLPLSFYSGMCAVFFMYIGYLCKHYSVFDKKCPVIIYFMMVLVGLYATYGSVYMSMVANRYKDGLMNFIGAVCISFVVIKFFKFWESKTSFGVNALAYVGRNTLLLICLHFIEAKFISWKYDVPNLLRHMHIPANIYTVFITRCLLLAVMFLLVKLFLKGFKLLKDRIRPAANAI